MILDDFDPNYTFNCTLSKYTRFSTDLRRGLEGIQPGFGMPLDGLQFLGRAGKTVRDRADPFVAFSLTFRLMVQSVLFFMNIQRIES